MFLVNVQDAYGYTALYFAAQRNHVEAVKCLLDYGAHPDGNNTYHVISKSNNIDNCEMNDVSGTLLSQSRLCKASPLHRAGEYLLSLLL